MWFSLAHADGQQSHSSAWCYLHSAWSWSGNLISLTSRKTYGQDNCNIYLKKLKDEQEKEKETLQVVVIAVLVLVVVAVVLSKLNGKQ